MKRFTLGTALVAGCFLSAALGAGFAIYLRPAAASRNSSGTMSAVNGPYVSGQVITASLFNNRLLDIEAEITNSADRSGRGGFLAPVRGIDGTLAAPALSFTSETGSGLWRNGAGDVRMSILGALREQWSATGAQITGSFGVGIAPAWPLHVQGPTASALQARFGASGDTPIGIFSAVTNPAVSANATNDGSTGWKYATSNSTLALLAEMGASGYIIYTGPIGTAGNAVTFTERFRVSPSGARIGVSGTAIANAVWGTCTIGVGTTCPITVQSGANCVCSWTTTTNPCAASVSGTTLTCTNGTVGITCNAICMN